MLEEVNHTQEQGGDFFSLNLSNNNGGKVSDRALPPCVLWLLLLANESEVTEWWHVWYILLTPPLGLHFCRPLSLLSLFVVNRIAQKFIYRCFLNFRGGATWPMLQLIFKINLFDKFWNKQHNQNLRDKPSLCSPLTGHLTEVMFGAQSTALQPF